MFDSDDWVSEIFGKLLVFAGFVGLIFAFNMDITVPVTKLDWNPDWDDGFPSMFKPKPREEREKRVVNLQKINDRYMILGVSAIGIFAGILIVGVSRMTGRQESKPLVDFPPFTCPHCGATLNRHPANPAWCVQCRAPLLWRDGRILSPEETASILKDKLAAETLEKEMEPERLRTDKLAWEKNREETKARRQNDLIRLKNLVKNLISAIDQFDQKIRQQVMRFFLHAKSHWVLHRLTAQQAAIRFRLGWEMYRNRIGDASVLQQIADLTGRIENPNNNLIRSWFLKREFKKLIPQLVVPPFESDSLPAALQGLYQELESCKTQLQDASEKLAVSKASLFPSDPKDRWQLGLGIPLLALTLLLFLIYVASSLYRFS